MHVTVTSRDCRKRTRRRPRSEGGEARTRPRWPMRRQTRQRPPGRKAGPATVTVGSGSGSGSAEVAALRCCAASGCSPSLCAPPRNPSPATPLFRQRYSPRRWASPLLLSYSIAPLSPLPTQLSPPVLASASLLLMRSAHLPPYVVVLPAS